MHNKTIHRIASLIMALIMILGNTMHTQAITGPSIYWGALVNGKVPSVTNLQGVFNTFETRSRKKMAIIHWGQPWMMGDGSWGEFQTSYFTNVRNHGSIPMLNWSSHRLGFGVNQADFQLRDIYGGRYDTYIRRWATAAKSWGHPFFLYFNPEMNGWWYPWGEGKLSGGGIVNGNSAGDFVRAWRHVHDIFTAVGATNATWVWGPNHMSTSSRYPALSTLYPGDAYVDWTGLSVFNKYSTWAGLNPLLTGSGGMTWFKNSYNAVLNVAPNKPMMLAQWASIEAGDGGTKKAAWITDALTRQLPINFPKIKAVVWFNWQETPAKTYLIESSTAVTSAWATGIASTMYAANQYANLNTSPIPALAASSTGTSATLADTSAEPSATLEASSTESTASPEAAPTEIAPTLEVLPTETTTLEALPAITSATFAAVADTYIDGANPTSTAGGTSTTLYVNASPVQTTFLRFDLTPLAGKTISSVTLRFKTTSDPAAGSVNGSNVKLVGDVRWKEQYMSYSNPVSISAILLGTVPANSAPDTWYEITLDSSAIQQKLGGLLSVAIESGGPDELLLYSREATDPPQLVITYN
jgi:mannan endo-1,4-beta-mannosidase